MNTPYPVTSEIIIEHTEHAVIAWKHYTHPKQLTGWMEPLDLHDGDRAKAEAAAVESAKTRKPDE